MGPKTALVLLTALSPLLLTLLVLGGPLVVWLGAPLICALPVLLIVVATRGRGPAGLSLFGIWLLLAGSWVGLGWLSATRDLAHPSAAEALAVTSWMLGGLGLMPLVLVAWVFARSFSSAGLSPEDLRRLREGSER